MKHLIIEEDGIPTLDEIIEDTEDNGRNVGIDLDDEEECDEYFIDYVEK